MRHIKYQRKISLLLKENRNLKFRLTIVNRKLRKLADLCKIFEIDISNAYSKKEINGKICNKSEQHAKPISPILEDLEMNMMVNPNNRSFSLETKLFSYTIYTISAQAYRVIREVMPLPSDSILRRTFSPDIKNIEMQFSDISNVKSILDSRGSKFDFKVQCSLSVDAFAVNNFSNTNNYAFIYLILPFTNLIRPFPIFLENTISGNANETTFSNINFILQQSQNSIFKIELVSVDGDRYYDPLFKLSRNLLEFIDLNDITQINFENIVKFFDTNDKLFLSSDFLHLLKNFRSKLLTDQIIINPDIKEPILTSEIEKILKLNKALTDKGSLAKLQDSYPLMLFTIGNALKVFYTAPFSSFFYILFFGLWNEAILNEKITLHTRLYYLETILFILLFFDKFLKETKMPEFVGFRKGENI